MKYIINIIISLFISIPFYAQHCSVDDVSTTSTMNIWNWQQTSFEVWRTNVGQTSLTSPFFWQGGNENINEFSIPPVVDKDFYVEDGWEAVYKNFGTEEHPVDNPGFVLYNRYEGILRIFIYLTENIENYDVATIDAELLDGNNRKMSGLFSYIEGPVKALDNFDKNIAVTSPNHWNNPQDGKWLHFDIPIAYDPCTCNRHPDNGNDTYGYLKIYPSLSEISTINFVYGKPASDKKKVVENNNLFLPKDFKAGINKLDGAYKAGTKTHKNTSSFVKFMETVVNAYKVDTTGYYEAQGDAIGAGVIRAEYNLNYNQMQNLKTTTLGLIKNIKQYGPEIGAILSVVDFLVVGKKSTASTTSNTIFTADGSLTDKDEFEGLEFFLPGSQYPTTSTNEVLIPIYDNILGVFGVLETPVAHRAARYGSHFTQNTEMVKLASDVKYTINPTSNMEVEDMRAALYFPINEANGSIATGPYCVETNLIKTYEATGDDSKPRLYYRTPYMSLKCLKGYTAVLTVKVCDNDLSCDQDFYYCSKIFKEKILGTPIIQLGMKLNTNSSVTNYREVNIVAKYETKETTISLIPSNSFGNQYTDVPTNRLIDSITLTQDMTLMAWEHVALGRAINTNGYKLTVISGGTIDLLTADYNPDIELIIDYPIACNGSVPQQTATEISSFCADNNKYKSEFDKKSEGNVLKPEKEGNFSMSVYPNPFSTSTTIEFSLEEEENVTLRLFNALGAEVETIIEQEALVAGEYQRVTRSDLPVGVYFAILQTDNGSQTIKIVKQ